MRREAASSTTGSVKTDSHPVPFQSVYFPDLNELMNDRLATILRYRLIGMSWTGAEEFYNDHQGRLYIYGN